MSTIPSGARTVLFTLLLLPGALLAQGDTGGSAAAQATAPATTAAASANATTAVADTAVKGEARDPVCGMVTKTEGQPSEVYRGTRFYFCNADCLDKFKADPSKTSTGLSGESCVCSQGGMKNCKCGHCTGKPERCDCGDPGHGKEDGEQGHGGHDQGEKGHDSHGQHDHGSH